jgi:hypothetical protein
MDGVERVAELDEFMKANEPAITAAERSYRQAFDGASGVGIPDEDQDQRQKTAKRQLNQAG